MNLDFATLVGAAAGLCSTVSFAPQAWRIIRTRDTTGLSFKMYAITVTGFAFWVAFGFLRGEWTIIAPNTICLAFSTFILVMIALPRGEMNAVADAIDPDAGAKKSPAGTSGGARTDS